MPSTKPSLVPTTLEHTDDKVTKTAHRAASPCKNVSRPSHDQDPSPQQRSNREAEFYHDGHIDCDPTINRASVTDLVNQQSMSMEADDVEPLDNSTASQSLNLCNDRQDELKDGEKRPAPDCNMPQRDATPPNPPHQDMHGYTINTAGDNRDSSYLPISMLRPHKRRQLRRQARRNYTEQAPNDSEDEYVPKKKCRQADSGLGRKKRSQHSDVYPRKIQAGHAEREPRIRKSHAIVGENGSGQPAIASYEEWQLSDTVLKCVREDGTATFQLQFACAITTCTGHSPQVVEASLKKDRPARLEIDPQITTEIEYEITGQGDASYLVDDRRNSQNLKPASLPDGAAIRPDIYQVECILARWGKNTFLLKWSDGTTGWEPRRHVLDRQMIRDFEEGYRGFDKGVDVVGTRTRAGKRQYLVRWHGRPVREESWVDEKKLNPKRLEQYQCSAC